VQALRVVVQTTLVAILSLEVVDHVVKDRINRHHPITPLERLHVVLLNNFKNALNNLGVLDSPYVYPPQEKQEQFLAQQNVADRGVDLFNDDHTLSS
jgi:hypothetical protein